MDDIELDLRGLKCPHPALRTARALERAPSGTCLVVACTDPLARIDIPHLVQQSGDVLEATQDQEGAIVFRIRKA